MEMVDKDDEREFQELDIPAMDALIERWPQSEELAARLLDELAIRRASSPAARALRAKLMRLPGARRFAGPASQPPGGVPPGGKSSGRPSGTSDGSSDPADRPSASGVDDAPPLQSTDPRAAQIAAIRPMSPGQPGSIEKALDATYQLPFTADASRATRYRTALDEYIKERREAKKGRRHEVRNGRRVSSSGSQAAYVFELSDTTGIYEGTEAELLIERREVRGSVRTIEGTEVTLDLAADLGAEVPKALLRLDDVKLLEKLRDRIQEVEGHGTVPDEGRPMEGPFNASLADAAVSEDTPPHVEAITGPPLPQSLNRSQQDAIRHVLAHALTFIWGPPGCGKTRTLGEVVRCAFGAGKRTLVCSNTNKAVDQVLDSICKVLGRDHPALQNGEVVRLGTIADEGLAKEFGALIDLDHIVARRTLPLKQELEEIERTLSATEREQATLRVQLARFAELDQAQARWDTLRSERAALAAELSQVDGTQAWEEQRLDKLSEELRRASGPLRIFRRSAEDVRTDIIAVREQLNQIQSKRLDIQDRLGDVRKKEAAAEKECSVLASSLAGVDRATCDRRQRELVDLYSALKRRHQEIEREIADLKARILREARVIGATGTRAYLTPAEMGALELVIVDEASMLLQPMVWLVAGMSRERLVLCGDFRQLPPVVDTGYQAIFDLIGRDAFDAAGLTRSDSANDRMVMLDTQYRMDPAICDLISGRMYAGRLKTTDSLGWRQERAARPRPPSPFDKTLTLIDTSGLRPGQAADGGSRFNPVHALLIRNLAHHLIASGFAKDADALAVCTPYRAQARMVGRILHEASLDRVHAGTVHTFQGDEREAIILDFPDGPGGRGVGWFLKGREPQDTPSRLVNVAVSRARTHLIVVANLAYLDRELPSDAMLRGILHDMQSAGAVVPGAALLELGPRGRDLAGLEDIVLDVPVRETGVFDSKAFDSAFAADVGRAKKSIAIFSGFVSEHRVSELRGMLADAASAGVRIRCVSRPPHVNFPKDPQGGARAFAALETIPSVVDGRARIHQKCVIVDGRIVWNGSLNVLSFSQRTDEIMTRMVGEEVARSFAMALAKVRVFRGEALEKLVEAENPRCEACEVRTFFNDTSEGRFFQCEDCGRRQFIEGKARGSGPRARLSSMTLEHLQTADRPYPQNGPPCPRCEVDTLLRLNGKTKTYFYGCSRYRSAGCRGTFAIPAEEARRPS